MAGPNVAPAKEGKQPAAKPQDTRQAFIDKFETKVRRVQIYSAVCCVVAALFAVLHSLQLLPQPRLDTREPFAQFGSVEFNVMMAFAFMHAVAALILYRRITPQRGAVGIALSLCASLVYILLFLAVHLSNFLDMQLGVDDGQGPPQPKEGSGLAMAQGYFSALKAQEEAAKAQMRGDSADVITGPGMLGIGEIILLALSSITDIVKGVLDPEKRAKAIQGPEQEHAPMFYIVRLDMLLLSLVGFVYDFITIFYTESYVQALAQAQPSAKKSRQSHLAKTALDRHVHAQEAKSAEAARVTAPATETDAAAEEKKKKKE